MPEGVVRSLKHRGLPAPDGALRDAGGNPTNDPAALYTDPRGTIQPLGGAFGYRGTALGMLVDVLAALLADDDTDDIARAGSNLAMLAIATDQEFSARARRMGDYIRTSPPLDDSRPVMLPGERELREARRAADGPISVDAPTWAALLKLAGGGRSPTAGRLTLTGAKTEGYGCRTPIDWRRRKKPAFGRSPKPVASLGGSSQGSEGKPISRAAAPGRSLPSGGRFGRETEMTKTKYLSGMAGAALLATATFAATGHAEDKQLYIIGVFHADVSNSFSSVVKKGVEQAGKDLDVKVEFVGPDKFDVVAQGQLIEAAIAKKPDGLFVSLPDCDALKPMVQEAVKAGIPVMSFNSGANCFKDVGSLVHVAEDGIQEGLGAGEPACQARRQERASA